MEGARESAKSGSILGRVVNGGGKRKCHFGEMLVKCRSSAFPSLPLPPYDLL
jgi:hypothetical protein